MECGNDLKIEVTRTMQMLKDIYAGLEQKNQRVLEITKSELDLNYEIYEKQEKTRWENFSSFQYNH